MLRVLVIDPVAKSRKALGALLTGETDIVVVSMRETIDGRCARFGSKTGSAGH